ncbi:O-glucosyltransferase rumi like [Pseudolycoriella hygida]|uniref:O-glucosyltransferase rumi like n=1 Tax=Pseudolycoriella hygida TaxID=35572 RepID=A0A9Q0MP31_9DIPT|nr:O-glucosyltransferase rumi like [Pseudolycoriella hygida]
MKRLLFVVFLLYFLTVLSNAELEEFCTIDGECESNNSDKSLKYLAEEEESYKKFAETLGQEIASTGMKFVPCEAQNCSCFFKRIEKDLSLYREGISKEMIDSVRRYGVKYQIVNGRLYRDKDCMFPARCAGVEHFLMKNLDKLHDTELIINCRDWPQIHSNWEAFGPVFSFSKTEDYHDIMYPAWSFWEGGPAISTYPTGLGRWDLMREKLSKAALEHPWSQKKNRAFFRGSRTSDERDSLVLLSRKFPNLVAAQYTKNQAWKSKADTLGAEPVNDVPMEKHCSYKYLFNFRGVAASFRFRHLFLCQSLVIHVGSEWLEFFYDALVPNYHFIQVSSYPKEKELRYLLRFLVENDKVAQTIAQRGFDAINKMLNMKDIDCYWVKLLSEYTNLLRFKVTRDKKLIEIQKKL